MSDSSTPALPTPITELKQAQEAWLASEARLSTAMEFARVGYWELPRSRESALWSEHVYSLYGIPGEYPAGVSTLLKIINPDDFPAYLQSMENAFSAGTEHRVIFRIYRHDNGEERWIDCRGKPVMGADGTPEKVVGFIQDITERKHAEEALRLSEARYHNAFQNSLDAIVLNRVSDGKFLDANPAFLDLFGYKRDEVVGHTSIELNIWYDLEDRRRLIELLQKEGRCDNLEMRFIHKDGWYGWGRMSASLVVVDDEPCIFAITRDITKSKLAEEALRTSEERYRSIFQTSHDGISVTRMSDGLIFDVNQTHLDLFGYARDEVVGNTSIALGHWADPTERQRFMEILLRDGSCKNFECLARKKGGETFWVMLSATVMEIEGVPCLLSYQKDITERKRSEEKIHQLAYYDHLTVLPNRTLLRERIKLAMGSCAKSGHHGALLLIDLDNFKALNDTLGHDMGDLLLQLVAQRLTDCVGEGDTVARLGGDEFIVLLTGLSESRDEATAQTERLGQKIHDAFRQNFKLKGFTSRITPSIGASLFCGDVANVTADELIKQADLAMYRVKDMGRNSIRFFEPEMEWAAVHRAKLESELREAIEHEQFVLHYQSQVIESQVVGAEVLVRWERPARGLVSPADFIPLAEENGLILPLGQWILETACKQLAAWEKRSDTAHLTIAVNVSAFQFRQPDFVDRVLQALESTGANPQRLKLELTESLLATDLGEVAGKMFALKAKGVGFALDDFGTGYSSLFYLKQLPLDHVKIDRTFVRDVLVDPNDATIVKTIITLAQSMGIGVIAEGVETAQQRDFLADAGCHFYQGYFFSRPVPIGDFEKIVLLS